LVIVLLTQIYICRYWWMWGDGSCSMWYFTAILWEHRRQLFLLVSIWNSPCGWSMSRYMWV